jgi:hypothetical protein
MHADRGQGIADVFELEGLDDRHNDFHVSGSRLERFQAKHVLGLDSRMATGSHEENAQIEITPHRTRVAARAQPDSCKSNAVPTLDAAVRSL